MIEEKKGLYLESTIPSYITARETKDVIKAARQSMTKLFWEQERHELQTPLLVTPEYFINIDEEGEDI